MRNLHLISLCIFSAFHFNVDCYLMGLPIFGIAFCILSLFSVLAAVMAYATLAVSTVAWAIACIIVSCSVAILNFLSICLQIPFVRLPYLSLPIFYCLCGCFCLLNWDFYFWHQAMYLALSKITLVDAYVCVFYCCACMRVYITICVCLYIQWWCTLADYIHDAYWLYYLH